MFRSLAFAGALACALAAPVGLGGCSNTGQLNGSAVGDVATAIAVGCPLLALIQKSGVKLNATQSAAAATLDLACPPNPPPTNAIVAGSDLIQAYTILKPLLK